MLNGALGPLDEILVIAFGFLVVWIAIRMAGRKPKDDEDEDVDQ